MYMKIGIILILHQWYSSLIQKGEKRPSLNNTNIKMKVWKFGVMVHRLEILYTVMSRGMIHVVENKITKPILVVVRELL